MENTENLQNENVEKNASSKVKRPYKRPQNRNYNKKSSSLNTTKVDNVETNLDTNQQNATLNDNNSQKGLENTQKTTKNDKNTKTVSNKPKKTNNKTKNDLSSHKFYGENNETAKTKKSNFNLVGKKNAFRVMFFGGVGEIGKNMMAVEYDNEIIVIDCGATFPNFEEMPGIDLVVPDISYLAQNSHKIKALLLTHGHEDHIGAIPYSLLQLNCPIYGSRLTLALVQNKLKEFPKIKPKMNSIKAGDVIKIGKFTVEFIRVCHSIAGSMAMAITTPVGTMVHTGDFKLDFQPINGELTDLTRFAELGKKGVLLLTCESTNVEREGMSMSESNVKKTLDGLFEKYKAKRIFVATFASNIHRLQQLLDLAEKYGRKVAFTGRSMINITETAYKIGELKFNRDNFIELDKIGSYKDEELLIISTGSQGEPMSALTRMVNGEFPKIKLDENDCIIMSSSPIPGNEKSVYNIINKLYRLGCDIIYSSLADVHASGHACKEELKIIHTLVNPKYFIPVHGEYRHLKLHKDLAESLGMDSKNIVIADIGAVVEVSKKNIKITDVVPSGNRLIDGLGVGDLESVVLKDRKQLSLEGLAVVLVGINPLTGEVTTGPDIISRGLVYDNEDNVIKEAKDIVRSTIKTIPLKDLNWNNVKSSIKKDLTNFFYKKTKRRPVILTIVLENS